MVEYSHVIMDTEEDRTYTVVYGIPVISMHIFLNVIFAILPFWEREVKTSSLFWSLQFTKMTSVIAWRLCNANEMLLQQQEDI